MSTIRNSQSRRWRGALASVSSIALTGTLLAATAVPAAFADQLGDEPYRPGYHFTPGQNWMNDPNGLVYYDGLYHLFFQHNPYGNDWGNMSWGHATSPDLMEWTQRGVAIPQTFNDQGQSIEDIFSGSVVVDWNNTSGFAPPGAQHPPLVAVYTSAYTWLHPQYAGLQAQSLAYSLDGGMTWEKYSGNPVLNRYSQNFRDPKVSWYDDGAGSGYWVMVAVEAIDHQVLFYKSDNLKDWYGADPQNPLVPLSTFGPANAVGGAWECPDLFKVPVLDANGDPTGVEKWVLVVNLNPGGVGGGSGGQYFIGDFDGTTFTSESTVDPTAAPTGPLVVSGSDFEGATWAPWTVTNLGPDNGPFGSGPANGTLDGQNPVVGFTGNGLVNSFVGHDGPKGVLESPSFTIDSNNITFQVGGGNHPHQADARLSDDPPAGTLLWNGFEPLTPGHTPNLVNDWGWEVTGDFLGAPQANPTNLGGWGYIGDYRLNSFESGPYGDENRGTMTSPPFEVTGDFLSMKVSGGHSTEGDLEIQLLRNGDVVRSITGENDGEFKWKWMDVSEFRGQNVQLRLMDNRTGGWGAISLDHVVMGDEPALPVSNEVTVNLVVNGQIVRSSTGHDSESLRWDSWDVRDLQGESATIKIIDNNAGGWGHILADHFIKTDAGVPDPMQQYRWLDWGRDYYATVSYSDVPGGKRIMQGWMSNWDYAGNVPTYPWQSAMTLPREVALTQTGEVNGTPEYELTQKVVDQFNKYTRPAQQVVNSGVAVAPGTSALNGLGAEMFYLELELDPGTASKSGVVVRASQGFDADAAQSAEGAQGTIIGYDSVNQRVYVDRTRSGRTDFSPSFPSTSSFPMAPDSNGLVKLEIYVDRGSVEVLTDSGVNSITDLILPAASSVDLLAFAEGGTANINSAKVTPVRPSMFLRVVDPVKPARVGNTITIPVVEGITYVDDAGNVLSGEVQVPSNNIVVRATSNSGFKLNPELRSTWLFPFDTNVDRVLVDPVRPVQVGNKVTVPVVEGITYVDGVGNVLAGEVPVPFNNLTVVAVAKSGYRLNPELRASWLFAFDMNARTVVDPVRPVQVGNTVTIPVVEGVVYKDGAGSVLAAGPVPVTTSNLVVVASPAVGYRLNPELRASWLFAFDMNARTMVDPLKPVRDGRSITIPTIPGVIYKDGDGNTITGQLPIPSTNLVVKAIPDTGYRLNPELRASWLFPY